MTVQFQSRKNIEFGKLNQTEQSILKIQMPSGNKKRKTQQHSARLGGLRTFSGHVFHSLSQTHMQQESCKNFELQIDQVNLPTENELMSDVFCPLALAVTCAPLKLP